MERFRLDIPKPCHEDWEKMTLDGNGRFCGSCAKTVVDFTKMKAAEIQQYFIENRGKKVCGRFQNNQLDSIIITIPAHVVFSQTQFHKMFLLALFVSMGTILFSCSDGNGNRQPIDRIEVTDEKPNTTLGLPIPVIAEDSANTAQKPKCDRVVKTGEAAIHPQMTKGVIVAKPQPPKITVYKDSITMSGGQ